MAQHYFEGDPHTASRPTKVDLVLPDLHLRLSTDRGVFSADSIDLGTRVLLESVPPPPPHGRLLDLGCGYGPIALTMALRAPQARILGVDVNRRACVLARENARNNHLDNVNFSLVDQNGTSSDTVADLTGPFEAIWSNPPIRVGKPLLHAMLRIWLDRLTPDGDAYLVVQRNLGADSLHRWLTDHGYPTDRFASRAGYRILHAKPARDRGDTPPHNAASRG